MGFSPVQSTEERIAVHVTPPPEKQAVWKVQRFLGRQKVNRANLIASLREKYGKETAAFANGSAVKDVDKEACQLWWIFDEQGHPAKFADSYQTAYTCQMKFSKASAGLDFDAEGAGMVWRATSYPWKRTSGFRVVQHLMIAVIAGSGAGDHHGIWGPGDHDMPLAVRAARAEVAWPGTSPASSSSSRSMNPSRPSCEPLQRRERDHAPQFPNDDPTRCSAGIGWRPAQGSPRPPGRARTAAAARCRTSSASGPVSRFRKPTTGSRPAIGLRRWKSGA
jgi:hypothetical protein